MEKTRGEYRIEYGPWRAVFKEQLLEISMLREPIIAFRGGNNQTAYFRRG
jgi:hypothetical protein